MKDDLREHPVDAASLDGKKSRQENPYSHLFRLLHWVLPFSMLAGMVTGLSLHAVARPEWSLFSGVLPSWLLGGQVQVYHFAAAVVSLAGLVAVLYLYWRRKTRRRAIHVILLAAGIVLAATGLVMLQPPASAWIYTVSRTLHFAAGLVILPVALLWHFGEGLVRFPRLLIPAFHPWASPSLKQLSAFVPLLLVAAVLILNILPKSLAGRQLTAKRVSASGDDLMALPWDTAQSLAIELADGVGFAQGRTQVTLQALHNGEDLFVRAQWADPTEDRQYQPWKKTKEGWGHLATVLDDECYYYEDKFSLVFPVERNARFEKFGCVACCHVGGGRPYGYKGDDETIDVWHWKATRVDPVGQIDDKYWSEVVLGETNGRHGDPSPGGGYKKNVAKEAAHPAFLPVTPDAVRQGGIAAEQAVPYDSDEAAAILAEMPVGTIVPGMVLSRFDGDRGDVECQSIHKDGRWEVLIRRKLDTGSEYDVEFVPGQTHSFGCAAFDHASKRHAYGFDTLGLKLEP
jgi:cytochrome b subunit of formate dehydrogenase